MSDHVRDNRSLLAAPEKRLLVAIARRLPRWVTSDQLTVLALAGMALSGAGYVLTNWTPVGLLLAVAGLAVNWFGDSLDGTVARVRREERPRFGFYVDHAVDILGASLLFGGLALSPHMSPVVALVTLVAYLLVSAEVYLSTAVRGVFRMSFAGFGPTELRIVLACGTMLLVREPMVTLGSFGQVRAFDLGGAIAAGGMVSMMVFSVLRNARALHLLESPLRADAQVPSAAPGALCHDQG